ncbi:MAG TPA: glycosyltransferase family 2 protein, partial [Candidatus Saccharimonadales bacterium]|nr:glycosyltransferase family 2 protein [Candidatus Saccharimonadales bacterium]
RGELTLEVVAVDNGSDDGSPEVLAGWPGVRLVRSPENEGFARAMNRALPAATGRYLLWLNPDCRLGPASLPAAVRALEALGKPAIAGPRLVGLDGRTQPSALAFNSPLTAVLHALGLRALLRLPGARRAAGAAAQAMGRGTVADYLATGAAHPEARWVDWLSGACLLVSRAAALRIGPLDEDFFMYSEDETWCRRAQACGVARVWLPEWTAAHDVRGSGSNSPYIACHYYRSLWLYHLRYAGAGRPVAGAAIVFVCLRRALAQGVRAAFGSREGALRARLWLGLARWVLGARCEPCGPLPPPRWPSSAEAARVR